VTLTSGIGLNYRPAANAEEVCDAWALVYEAYVRTGLIDPNPHSLHTYPQILDSEYVVIIGQIDSLTVSTLSAYVGDAPGSLPLESIFANEIDEFRQQGKRLLELGLFADRRQHIFRSFDALLELMRFTTYFGICQGCSDAVIGVHPDHVGFYERILGFEAHGTVKPHPGVRGHPAVLMQMDWSRQSSREVPAKGIRYFLDHPLDASAFAERCRSLDLGPDVIHGLRQAAVPGFESQREAG